MPIDADPRSLSTDGDLRDILRRMSVLFDHPPATVTIEAAIEDADARDITLRVRDRLLVPWQRRFALLAWIADAEDGPPGGTQTVAWITGDVLLEIAADQAWLLLTDAAGEAEARITIAGTASRWLNALPLYSPAQSEEIAWA